MLTNEKAAELILGQADANGISACRMKDSTLVCITVSMLQKLLKHAENSQDDKVIILIKNGQELGIS